MCQEDKGVGLMSVISNAQIEADLQKEQAVKTAIKAAESETEYDRVIL